MRQISHVEVLSSTVCFGVRFNLSDASDKFPRICSKEKSVYSLGIAVSLYSLT